MNVRMIRYNSGTQYSTEQIIFPFIFQTIIIALLEGGSMDYMSREN